jgi:hypothetical protein
MHKEIVVADTRIAGGHANVHVHTIHRHAADDPLVPIDQFLITFGRRDEPLTIIRQRMCSRGRDLQIQRMRFRRYQLQRMFQIRFQRVKVVANARDHFECALKKFRLQFFVLATLQHFRGPRRQQQALAIQNLQFKLHPKRKRLHVLLKLQRLFLSSLHSCFTQIHRVRFSHFSHDI